MGKLTEQIRADLTESMKARDADRTSTLRMLQSAIKYEQINVGHELSDEEAMAVIRRGIKQRQDSVSVNLTGLLSQVKDVDMASAITNFSMAQVVYQASLKASAQTMQISLLDYLR